jgi:hypothetical protein
MWQAAFTLQRDTILSRRKGTAASDGNHIM